MQNFIEIIRAVVEKFEVFQKGGVGKNKFIAAIVLRKIFQVLKMCRNPTEVSKIVGKIQLELSTMSEKPTQVTMKVGKLSRIRLN